MGSKLIFVSGILVGIILSVSTTAFADTIGLIGKKVEGEFAVTLDGKQLTSKAGVIEGTSYLPVRAVSEALGLDVGFDPEKGISLGKKEERQVPVTSGSEIPLSDIEDNFTFQGVEAIHYKGEPYFSRTNFLEIYGNRYNAILEKPFEIEPAKSSTNLPFFVFYDEQRKEIGRAKYPEGKIGFIIFFQNGRGYIHTKYFPKELIAK